MRIAITIGDCNGIGIEVMLKALSAMESRSELFGDCEISLVGNTNTLKSYIDKIKFPLIFKKNGLAIGKMFCKIIECNIEAPVEFGKNSERAGALASEAIEMAATKTLAKEFDAMITMPVSKESLYMAGWKYPGHTEMLAVRCGVDAPLMVLCTKTVRVALATIHIPLRQVPKSLTSSSLFNITTIFHKSLTRDFKRTKPRIALLGLNPHAGEGGSIGTEEIYIIKPAIEKCTLEGLNVQGPYPADGFFAHGDYRFYDGVVAMYHDQGLIPLKLLAHGAGVNFTAGLPIVRTSADHGTAFSIAGKDKADETSSLEAIEMAMAIVQSRRHCK